VVVSQSRSIAAGHYLQRRCESFLDLTFEGLIELHRERDRGPPKIERQTLGHPDPQSEVVI